MIKKSPKRNKKVHVIIEYMLIINLVYVLMKARFMKKITLKLVVSCVYSKESLSPVNQHHRNTVDLIQHCLFHNTNTQ